MFRSVSVGVMMAPAESAWRRRLRIVLLLGFFWIWMAGVRFVADWLNMQFPDHAKLIEMLVILPLMGIGLSFIIKPLMRACAALPEKPESAAGRATKARKR